MSAIAHLWKSFQKKMIQMSDPGKIRTLLRALPGTSQVLPLTKKSSIYKIPNE